MLLQSCEHEERGREEKAELSLRKLVEGVADVSSAKSKGGGTPSQCGLDPNDVGSVLFIVT